VPQAGQGANPAILGAMPHRFAIVLLAIALGLSGAAPAPAAPACAAPPPAVTVKVNLADPVIDNSLPQPALQKIAGPAYHGGHTLGLYRAEYRASWTTRLGERSSAGETCRWIESVAIEIATPKRTIYVIRERKPGTCYYESVLAHERKHEAADDAVVAAYLPRLEQEVRAAAAAAPSQPGAGRDGTAARRRLLAPVEAAIKRGLVELDEARRARQSRIDTPQEYRRVGAACG
jgi:hypothetical protein